MSLQFFFLNQDEEVVGILNDALTCKVHESTYQAEFTFENTDVFSFEDCAYVGFVDINSELVFYEIIDVNPAMDGTTSITAEHAAMTELLQEVVESRAVAGAEAGFAVQRVLENTRWTLKSAQPTPQMSTSFWYKNVWECLETIRTYTNCALYFGWTISAGRISERYVIVKTRAGTNRGKRFDLSKDLTSIDVHIDKSGIYTLLYGRGKGEEVGTNINGDATYGRRITIADIEWSVANGDPCDKAAGIEYLEDASATQQFGRSFGDNKRPRKGVIIFEDCTDPQELIELTWKKLQSVKYPKLSISGKVVDLERVWEYSHEAIRLGDDVTVIADEWNATYQDVVVDIVRDYLNPLETKVTIGEEGKTTYSIQSELSSAIESVKEKADIGSSVATANPDLLRGVINTMVTQIMSSGTGISTDPGDGSFILTSNDGSSAVKITGAGILISDTKEAGAWVWKTALSGSGIATETLTAGVIQASLIKILGTEQFYWDSSNIIILNPENTDQQIRIGLYDGTNYGIAFTQDGGATWQSAISFDGVHFSAGEIDNGISIGDTAPEDPMLDEIWMDTSSVPNVFWRWDGSMWITVGQEVDNDIDEQLTQVKAEMQNYVDTKAASADDLASFEKTVGGILDIDENGETTLIQRIYQAIDASGDTASNQYKEILRYIRFVNGRIVLGEEGNAITLEIVNDRISFKQNGDEVQWISEKAVNMRNAIIQKGGIFQLGSFGFVPEEDGSLSFLLIGSEANV